MKYIVKGLINGRWKKLNTGGVSLGAAQLNAAMQSALRRCQTVIVPCGSGTRKRKR